MRLRLLFFPQPKTPPRQPNKTPVTSKTKNNSENRLTALKIIPRTRMKRVSTRPKNPPETTPSRVSCPIIAENTVKTRTETVLLKNGSAAAPRGVNIYMSAIRKYSISKTTAAIIQYGRKNRIKPPSRLICFFLLPVLLYVSIITLRSAPQLFAGAFTPSFFRIICPQCI